GVVGCATRGGGGDRVRRRGRGAGRARACAQGCPAAVWPVCSTVSALRPGRGSAALAGTGCTRGAQVRDGRSAPVVLPRARSAGGGGAVGAPRGRAHARIR